MTIIDPDALQRIGGVRRRTWPAAQPAPPSPSASQRHLATVGRVRPLMAAVP